MNNNNNNKKKKKKKNKMEQTCVCVCGPSEKTLNFYPLILFELLFPGLLVGFAFLGRRS